MKAVVIREHGGIDKLNYTEIDTPEPAPGQVRVQIKASGVNHFDHDIREGVSGVQQKLPHVPGVEGVGVIEALGEGVSNVKIGQRVAIFMPQGDPNSHLWLKGLDGLDFTHGRIGVDLWGTYAQYCVCRADAVVPLADELDFETAAASIVCFGTAWHMTVVQGRVEAGQTVLVNAAGSGVGSSAIQVAKLHGARVIASAGSDAKLERAKQLGADEVVNYTSQNLRDECLRLTGGEGVDLVIESVGGEVLRHSVEAVRADGHLVTCGAHAGEIVPINIIELFRKRMHFHGSHFCGRRELKHVLGLVAQKRLKPVIHAVMPMSQVREAATRTADRNFFGKMVLLPD